LQASSTGYGSYAGDGWNGFYVWGSQFEAGAFATSYIPTVASQVTRSADSASMTGSNFSSWYNYQQGTFYCEYARLASGTQNTTVFSAGVDGSNYINYYGSAGSDFLYGSSQGSAGVLNQTYGATSTSYKKFALSLAVNNVVGTYNAVSPVTDTSYPQPNNFTALYIGQNYLSQANMNGYLKKLAYYPIACTSAQLQGLTG
jgi:hypothetical protein